MSGERQTCRQCGTEYFASEHYCPKCRAPSPWVLRQGRAARTRVALRRWLRRIVIVAVLGCVASGGRTWWLRSPQRVVRQLQAAWRERDADAFVVHCDLDAMVERMESEEPGLVGRMLTTMPGEAETARDRDALALEFSLRRAIEDGRDLGAWAEANRPELHREGDEVHVTGPGGDPADALGLRRDAAGSWRVVRLGWGRLPVH